MFIYNGLPLKVSIILYGLKHLKNEEVSYFD
jgi:hypothetical protein